MDFVLRKWTLEDAPAMQRYADNPRIPLNLRDGFPSPYTLEDAYSFLKGILDKDEQTQCLRAIVVDGEVVGSIGVFLLSNVYRKTAEIGYWLGEPFWGKGIMSAAVQQMCEYAFANYDLVRIEADIFEGNHGSCRVVEKAGFVLEGIKRKCIYKNGQIRNSCMYAKVIE